jgi:hypothetical protein
MKKTTNLYFFGRMSLDAASIYKERGAILEEKSPILVTYGIKCLDS